MMEKKAIADHFVALGDVLTNVFNAGPVRFKLQKREGYPDAFIPAVLLHLQNCGRTIKVSVIINKCTDKQF